MPITRRSQATGEGEKRGNEEEIISLMGDQESVGTMETRQEGSDDTPEIGETAGTSQDTSKPVSTEKSDSQNDILTTLYEMIKSNHAQISKKFDDHIELINKKVETTSKNLEERLVKKFDLRFQQIDEMMNNKNTNLREELLQAHDNLKADTQHTVDQMHTDLQTKIVGCVNQTKALEERVQLEVTTIAEKHPDREEIQERVLTLLSENELQINKEFDNIRQTHDNIHQGLRGEIERLKQNANNPIFNIPNFNLMNSGIKVENLMHFDGDRLAIHPITYLNNILRYIDDLPDYKTKMNVIRATLKQAAAEWLQRVEENCETIEQFSTLFKRNFWNEGHQDQVKAKLLTGKYRLGQLSREAYATRIYNTCKYVNDLPETTIVRQLLNHFILTDTHAIICQNINDMDALIDILRKLDNHEANNQSRTNTPTRNHLNRPSNTHLNQGYQPRPYIPSFNQNQQAYNTTQHTHRNMYIPNNYPQGGQMGNNNSSHRYDRPNINNNGHYNNYSRSAQPNYPNNTFNNATRNSRQVTPQEGRRQLNNIGINNPFKPDTAEDSGQKKTPIAETDLYRDPIPSSSQH